MKTAMLRGKRVLLGRFVAGGREIVFMDNCETQFLPEIQLRDLEDIKDTDDDLPYVQHSTPFVRRDKEWLKQHRQLREQKTVNRPSRAKKKSTSRKKTTRKKPKAKQVSPEFKEKIRKMPPNMQEAIMKDMGIDSLD